MNKVHIIAEAGTNHNGQYATAEQLAQTAKIAGADSVKFQIIYPEGLYLPKLFDKSRYVDNEVFLTRQKFMLSDTEYSRLADYCRQLNLSFSASVFDERGLNLLDELDAPYIKIASCDLNNSRLLKQAAERGRQIVLSTGMATLAEIDRAVADITATGHNKVVLMHCVSIYPAPLSQMNLTFLDTLITAFGLPVGLSDHTEGSLAAAIAVSKGVTWLEKHFTLDRTSPGFDHAYAMEPPALTQYVTDVRSAETACHRPSAKISQSEATVKQRARRGLYAARDMAAGETLTAADILIVRPEGPLRPNEMDLVMGKPLKQQIYQYQALSLELV